MSNIYLFRRKTAADWTSANPVLMAGELGLETDTAKFKFGNGTTAWNSLAYSGSSGGAATWGSITGTLASQADLVAALAAKQATLVSGTNLKTINGNTLLGPGDLSISGGGGISDGDKGDITVSGSGAVWTIDAGAVTVSKMANLAAGTILGNNTGGATAPIALTATQVKTLLAITASDVSGFDEAAQDAVGAMVDASLTYVDATPLLQRAALTGAITASAGSNTTSLGSFTKAQLDAAVSDADLAILAANTFTGLQTIPSLNLGLQSIATAAATTTLTSSSPYHTIFTGATTQTVVLPDATTLSNGQRVKLSNNSTGAVTVQTNGGATLWIIAGSATDLDLTLSDNSTAAGTWELDYRVGKSASGKSSTFNNSFTFSGTDGTSFTFPATSGTLALAAGSVTSAPATDQANWSPAGFGATTAIIDAQPTTNSWVTGLVAGAADQEVTVLNDSLFVMCFECESSVSTAANRFAKVPDTLWLLPAQTITFRYNSSLSRWVVTSQSFPVLPISSNSQALLPGQATTIQTVGRGGSSNAATLSHVSPSGGPTDDFLEYGYVQGTNSTAAGTTSIRSNPNYWMRGSVAGRQGFIYTAKVRFTALGATGAVRAGMTNSAAALTTLNAALTHCVLLGADGGMTTLRIFRGDAAAGTPIDLGANFPVPSATASYEVFFYAPTNSSFIRYMVRRLDTRFVAEGSLTANLPGNTQTMGQRVEAMVGGTAVANTWQASLSMVMGL